MYPLRLCAFCPYGPKAVREAASLLFCGVARTPNRVGWGLAPAVCAVRTPNLVGTGVPDCPQVVQSLC